MPAQSQRSPRVWQNLDDRRWLRATAIRIRCGIRLAVLNLGDTRCGYFAASDSGSESEPGVRAVWEKKMTHQGKKWSIVLLTLGALLALGACQKKVATAPPPPPPAAPTASAYRADESSAQTPITSAQPSPQELQQLVAPIALYPDSLVAQVLAASTYPAQVVEADRWLQAHPGLKAQEVAKAVDQEPWDPSVKALTEFPPVLANMDKNLSWTSSLGDAYINDQQGVMNAVQQMRSQAEKAGNLKSTAQLKVSDDSQAVIIEPVEPEIVYVPEYDPWLIYGIAVVPWPGWYWYPGLYWTYPGWAFGIGFDIGFFAGYGWGWHHWGWDWHHYAILYNHSPYISHSSTVVNRNYYASRAHINSSHGAGAGLRGGNASHGSPHAAPRPAPSGGHFGAFSGYHDGGETRGYSSRGFSSMGGFHGGGGGFHGGGDGGRR